MQAFLSHQELDASLSSSINRFKDQIKNMVNGWIHTHNHKGVHELVGPAQSLSNVVLIKKKSLSNVVHKDNQY